MSEVKERPILFSTPMVQAILEGRKTQTRRIVKPQPTRQLANMKMGYFSEEPDNIRHPYQKCPYGQVGDRLWVRETWAGTCNTNNIQPLPWVNRPHIEIDENSAYIYRADGEWDWCDEDGFMTERSYWKPSIFMPRHVSRILLEITGIRVERLQDINEADAFSEGVEACFYTVPKTANNDPLDLPGFTSSVPGFQKLWQSINGPDSWEVNPWVWVVEFKQIGKEPQP